MEDAMFEGENFNANGQRQGEE